MNLKILAIGLIGCFTLVYGTPGFQYVSGGISADAALQKLDLQKNKAEMKIQTIKDNIERITDDSAKTKFTIELLGLEHTFKALSNKIKDRKLRYVPKNLSRLLSNFKELLSNLSALEAELHKKAIDNPQIFNGTLNATPKTYCHDDCQCLAESLEDSLSSSATNLWSIGNKILELPEGKRKADFAGRLEDVTNRLIDIKKSHINKFAEYSDEKMSFPKDALAAAVTKTTALKSEIAELKNDVVNELRKLDQHESSGEGKYVSSERIYKKNTLFKSDDRNDDSKLNLPKNIKIEMVENITMSKSNSINGENKLTERQKIFKTIVLESEDKHKNKRCVWLKPDENIRKKRSHSHNIPKDKTKFILIGHGCTTCKNKGTGPYTVKVVKVIPERKSSHSEEKPCKYKENSDECKYKGKEKERSEECECKDKSKECKCPEKYEPCKCKENDEECKCKEEESKEISEEYECKDPEKPEECKCPNKHKPCKCKEKESSEEFDFKDKTKERKCPEKHKASTESIELNEHKELTEGYEEKRKDETFDIGKNPEGDIITQKLSSERKSDEKLETDNDSQINTIFKTVSSLFRNPEPTPPPQPKSRFFAGVDKAVKIYSLLSALNE